MSSIKLSPNASGTGEFTIAAPNSNTNRTLTLPDQTGTVLTNAGPFTANASASAGAVTIDASNNVGIGTGSPTDKVKVVGGNVQVPRDSLIGSSATGDAIVVGTSGGSHIKFVQNGSDDEIAFITHKNGVSHAERARITAAGDLLVGTTSTSTPTSSTADVYLGGIIMAPSRRTTGSAANVNIDATSGIFARSTSSLKYKRDVQNATHGLAKVMALRPVTYKGKSEADGDKVFGGLIAEEVHEAGLTEFVQYAGDGSPDSLAYGNMVALAFKAIQELKAEVDALKAQLGAQA